MARQVTVEFPTDVLEQVQAGQIAHVEPVTDSDGKQWRLTIQQTDRVIVTLAGVARWTIAVEGVVIGEGEDADPGEALITAFKDAQINALPEAVVAKVFNTDETWVVFTLSGEQFKMPADQFNETVEKSDNWVQARRARRNEIEALQADLRKITGS
jgi:hypothetical protein